ncbi:hypothetical protein KM043_012344 [Ampulex compressa]|nr:hypothetical protein KM043_012344 [Ampulex compressa]
MIFRYCREAKDFQLRAEEIPGPRKEKQAGEERCRNRHRETRSRDRLPGHLADVQLQPRARARPGTPILQSRVFLCRPGPFPPPPTQRGVARRHSARLGSARPETRDRIGIPVVPQVGLPLGIAHSSSFCGTRQRTTRLEGWARNCAGRAPKYFFERKERCRPEKASGDSRWIRPDPPCFDVLQEREDGEDGEDGETLAAREEARNRERSPKTLGRLDDGARPVQDAFLAEAPDFPALPEGRRLAILAAHCSRKEAEWAPSNPPRRGAMEPRGAVGAVGAEGAQGEYPSPLQSRLARSARVLRPPALGAMAIEAREGPSERTKGLSRTTARSFGLLSEPETAPLTFPPDSSLVHPRPRPFHPLAFALSRYYPARAASVGDSVGDSDGQRRTAKGASLLGQLFERPSRRRFGSLSTALLSSSTSGYLLGSPEGGTNFPSNLNQPPTRAFFRSVFGRPADKICGYSPFLGPQRATALADLAPRSSAPGAGKCPGRGDRRWDVEVVGDEASAHEEQGKWVAPGQGIVRRSQRTGKGTGSKHSQLGPPMPFRLASSPSKERGRPILREQILRWPCALASALAPRDPLSRGAALSGSSGGRSAAKIPDSHKIRIALGPKRSDFWKKSGAPCLAAAWKRPRGRGGGGRGARG